MQETWEFLLDRLDQSSASNQSEQGSDSHDPQNLGLSNPELKRLMAHRPTRRPQLLTETTEASQKIGGFDRKPAAAAKPPRWRPAKRLLHFLNQRGRRNDRPLTIGECDWLLSAEEAQAVADQDWDFAKEVPPGVRRSQSILRNRLPELLKIPKLHDRWICQHEDECVGIHKDKNALVEECERRGLPFDSYYIGLISSAELDALEELNAEI